MILHCKLFITSNTSLVSFITFKPMIHVSLCWTLYNAINTETCCIFPSIPWTMDIIKTSFRYFEPYMINRFFESSWKGGVCKSYQLKQVYLRFRYLAPSSFWYTQYFWDPSPSNNSLLLFLPMQCLNTLLYLLSQPFVCWFRQKKHWKLSQIIQALAWYASNNKKWKM